MSQSQTLVTPEMEQAKGLWGQDRQSYPISESDIRKWSIAVYWPETPPRLFLDDGYARTTSWGGIVAPEDFNPFAWPVPMGDAAQFGGLPGLRSGGNIMNGGQSDTFGVRMRPGDVITSRLRLSDWKERQGSSAKMLFTYYETEWRNQKDEVVKSRISTVIQF